VAEEDAVSRLDKHSFRNGDGDDASEWRRVAPLCQCAGDGLPDAKGNGGGGRENPQSLHLVGERGVKGEEEGVGERQEAPPLERG
jgi:hypothetical protein